jgi:Icc protein
MNITRRQLFRMSAATCAVATTAIGSASPASAMDKAPRLTLLANSDPVRDGTYGNLLASMAVLSDTHVYEGESIQDNNLANALNDISENWGNNDAILLNGDLTDNGYDSQYDVFSQIAEVAGYAFPSSFISVMGNHEIMGDGSYTPESYSELTSTFLRRTGNEFLYFDRYIGESHIIVLGPDQYVDPADAASCDKFCLSDTQLSWLASLLDADESEGRTSFVFIHEPLKNTVTDSYPGGWGYDNSLTDDAALHSVIYTHSHTILFSGHTHSFPDVVQQSGGNLYVGTGSVAYAYAKNETYLTDDGSYDSYGWLVRHHEQAVEFCMRDFLNHEWVAGSHYLRSITPAE